MDNFAEWLSKNLTISGLTVSELARRADISQGYLSSLRSGKRTGVSLSKVVKIARVLGAAPEAGLEAAGFQTAAAAVLCVDEDETSATLVRRCIEELDIRAAVVAQRRADALRDLGDADRKVLRQVADLIVLLSSTSASNSWMRSVVEAMEVWGINVTLLHIGAPQPSSWPATYKSFDALKLSSFAKFLSAVSQTPQDSESLNDSILRHAAKLKALAEPGQEKKRALDVGAQYLLYGKSTRQFEQNEAEAGRISASFFRKAQLASAFENLYTVGQLTPVIQSIDEYWVAPLASQNRLLDLTDLIDASTFVASLVESCRFDSRIWACPHFVDFGFYSIRSGYENSVMRACQLAAAGDLDKLQARAQAAGGRLLAYDFHTPDTVACTVFEFAAACGIRPEEFRVNAAPAADSFVRRMTKAMQALRIMVGSRRRDDFEAGDPLNLDDETERAPLLRHWTSMAPDEIVCFSDDHDRRAVYADENFPIRGTLGGWYVAVLNPGRALDGETDAVLNAWRLNARNGIERLLTFENQLQRFKNRAGIPVLKGFYRSPQYAEMEDTNSQLQLSAILQNLDDPNRGFLTRSQVGDWHRLVNPLWRLHAKSMTGPWDEIDDGVREFADTLRSRRRISDGKHESG